MPSHSEYSIIAKNLDKEMRELVREYEMMKEKKNRAFEQKLKKIRVKHPMFQNISIPAFMYLINKG